MKKSLLYIICSLTLVSMGITKTTLDISNVNVFNQVTNQLQTTEFQTIHTTDKAMVTQYEFIDKIGELFRIYEPEVYSTEPNSASIEEIKANSIDYSQVLKTMFLLKRSGYIPSIQPIMFNQSYNIHPHIINDTVSVNNQAFSAEESEKPITQTVVLVDDGNTTLKWSQYNDFFRVQAKRAKRSILKSLPVSIVNNIDKDYNNFSVENTFKNKYGFDINLRILHPQYIISDINKSKVIIVPPEQFWVENDEPNTDIFTKIDINVFKSQSDEERYTKFPKIELTGTLQNSQEGVGLGTGMASNPILIRNNSNVRIDYNLNWRIPPDGNVYIVQYDTIKKVESARDWANANFLSGVNAQLDAKTISIPSKSVVKVTSKYTKTRINEEDVFVCESSVINQVIALDEVYDTYIHSDIMTEEVKQSLCTHARKTEEKMIDVNACMIALPTESKCQDCNATIYSLSPLVLHDLIGTGIQVEPTCTTNGYSLKVCQNGCGYVSTNITEKALGHDYHSFMETSNPTCLKGGIIYALECERCGDRDVLDAQPLGRYNIEQKKYYHNYILDAYYNIYCKTCDKFSSFTLDNYLDMLNEYEHYKQEFGEALTSEEHDVIIMNYELAQKMKSEKCKHVFWRNCRENIEATCKEYGEVQAKCEKCGNRYTIEYTKKEHSLEYTYTKLPTCTETGNKHKQCKYCDELTEDIEIPKNGHNITSAIVTRQAFNCAPGTFIGHCKECEQNISDTASREYLNKYTEDKLEPLLMVNDYHTYLPPEFNINSLFNMYGTYSYSKHNTGEGARDMSVSKKCRNCGAITSFKTAKVYGTCSFFAGAAGEQNPEYKKVMNINVTDIAALVTYLNDLKEHPTNYAILHENSIYFPRKCYNSCYGVISNRYDVINIKERFNYTVCGSEHNYSNKFIKPEESSTSFNSQKYMVDETNEVQEVGYKYNIYKICLDCGHETSEQNVIIDRIVTNRVYSALPPVYEISKDVQDEMIRATGVSEFYDLYYDIYTEGYLYTFLDNYMTKENPLFDFNMWNSASVDKRFLDVILYKNNVYIAIMVEDGNGNWIEKYYVCSIGAETNNLAFHSQNLRKITIPGIFYSTDFSGLMSNDKLQPETTIVEELTNEHKHTFTVDGNHLSCEKCSFDFDAESTREVKRESKLQRIKNRRNK